MQVPPGDIGCLIATLLELAPDAPAGRRRHRTGARGIEIDAGALEHRGRRRTNTDC